MRRKLAVVAVSVIALVAVALLLRPCGSAEDSSAPSASGVAETVRGEASPRRRERIRATRPDGASPRRREGEARGEAPPALAPPAPDEEAPAPPPVVAARAEVSGRVLLAADSQPAAGVTITLRRRTSDGKAETRSTETDLGGAFRFREVPPGLVVVSASKDGYAPRRTSKFEVKHDAGRSGIELLLATGGTIEGRVLDENEAPLAGVRIALARGNPNTHVADTATDDDGWYRFEHLLPEHYHVEAHRSPTESQSGFVRLVDGQIARLDFRTDASLVGAVLDAEGKPLVGAYITAWSEGPPTVSRKGETDDAGRYRIPGLAPGEWSLQVQTFGADGFAASAGRLQVVVGDNDHTIRVEAGEISGKLLVRSTGAPPSPHSIQLSARPLDGSDGPFGSAMAWAKADGSYRFAGLRAGRYRVRVDSLNRSTRVLERDVDLAPAERKSGVDLELELIRTGRVRIVARDEEGKPAEGLTVAIIVGETSLVGPTPSPAPGVYVLRLEVGVQTLELSRQGLETLRIDPEVQEGETTTVEVVMTREPTE